MDHETLRKFFPLSAIGDPEILDAQQKLRESANDLAININKLLPESQQKMEFLMRLLHLMKDVNMALDLDGVNTLRPMIVTH